MIKHSFKKHIIFFDSLTFKDCNRCEFQPGDSDIVFLDAKNTYKEYGSNHVVSKRPEMEILGFQS